MEEGKSPFLDSNLFSSLHRDSSIYFSLKSVFSERIYEVIVLEGGNFYKLHRFLCYTTFFSETLSLTEDTTSYVGKEGCSHADKLIGFTVDNNECVPEFESRC